MRPTISRSAVTAMALLCLIGAPPALAGMSEEQLNNQILRAKFGVRMPAHKGRRVLVVGATGGLGQRVLRFALEADYDISVLVDSKADLAAVFAGWEPAAGKAAEAAVPSFAALLAREYDGRKRIFEGTATDAALLAAAVVGQQTVIEALADDVRPRAIGALVSAAAGAGVAALVALGGSSALEVSAGVPAKHAGGAAHALQELHHGVLGVLRGSSLAAWTTVNPGPMVPSDDGAPTGLFEPRADVLDLAAFEEGAPAMTFEDVALIMVQAADVANSGYDKHMIGLALKPKHGEL
jgi:putative NADH-flavin reductase